MFPTRFGEYRMLEYMELLHDSGLPANVIFTLGTSCEWLHGLLRDAPWVIQSP